MSGPDGWDQVATKDDVAALRNDIARSFRRFNWCMAIINGLIWTVAVIILLASLAGCGTTALKPEPKLISSVTSLPPVEIPIPVSCVKDVTGPDADRFVNGIPKIPNVAIDPNATPLQRSYQKKEALIAAEQYVIDANGVILGCAAKEPKQ